MSIFGSESKFESSVKLVPYSQQAVYHNISDLRNLEKVRDRVPEDKVNDFSFDQDTVSLRDGRVARSLQCMGTGTACG